MAAAVTRMASPRINTGKISSPRPKKAAIKDQDNPSSIAQTVEGNASNKDKTSDGTFALPPKPTLTNNDDQKDATAAKQADSTQANGDAHFSKEPNPFENAFGAPSDTPGKTQLPGVTSLTSPAPLLGGITPGWPGSLRSGPLSPAMLTGPAQSDYFSHEPSFAGSFPTPNESSLRTGLTPGGAGTMFPQPSPNSQAIFNAMQNGGATPGTLDFHRTAMHARAANGVGGSSNNASSNNESASQDAADRYIQPNLDHNGFAAPAPPQRDNFEQHDTDAANGLYMLAQANQANQTRPVKQEQTQYPAPGQQPQMNYMPNAPLMHGEENTNANDVSKRAAKNSIGSNMSGSANDDDDDEPDAGEETGQKGHKSRARVKKGSAGKAGNGGRRKAENTPTKGVGGSGANKKQKMNSGVALLMDEPGESDEEPEVTHHPDGRKLTDEEKRKNFLERNRIAALKCRQRKKQWLANLQQKVEIFSTENDALAATVTQLREEIVGLKTLLLSHKDCPVSIAQGFGGMAMQNIAGDAQQQQQQFQSHPYAMAMGQNMHQHGMPQANMQRR